LFHLPFLTKAIEPKIKVSKEPISKTKTMLGNPNHAPKAAASLTSPPPRLSRHIPSQGYRRKRNPHNPAVVLTTARYIEDPVLSGEGYKIINNPLCPVGICCVYPWNQTC